MTNADDGSTSSEARRPPLTKNMEQDLRIGLQTIRDEIAYLETCNYPGALGERFATKCKSLQRAADYIDRLTGASASKRSEREATTSLPIQTESSQ